MKKSMEGMHMDVLSVQQNVHNIEIKEETTTVGVLQEVFGVGNSSFVGSFCSSDSVSLYGYKSTTLKICDIPIPSSNSIS